MGHMLSAVLRWEADGSTLGHGLLLPGCPGQAAGHVVWQGWAYVLRH